MSRITANSKQTFQDSLHQRLKQRYNDESLLRFANQYFSQVSLPDIVQHDWDYAENKVVSSWEFFQSYKGKQPRVRVFNPTLKQHGYEHRQTMIEVASPNLAFLLDSIRIELANQGLVLTDVQQCVMHVVRSSSNDVIIVDDDQTNETLIHLEVEHIAKSRELETALRGVIRRVVKVVSDFDAMRKQLLLCSDELAVAGQSDQEVNEAFELLKWLYANNFTFLGYEEFKPGKRGLERIPGMMLGLAPELSNPVPDEPVKTVMYSKSPIKSEIHRPAFLDEVTVRLTFRGNRRICRFLGLFTSSAYNQNPNEIPMVRTKIASIFEHLGLPPGSHKGREVERIVEILPREELFLSTPAELIATVEQTYQLQERRVVKVLARRDQNGHFVSCIVYVPRDTYDTALRIRIQELLLNRFNAETADFSTFFSESVLTRTHFILKVDPSATTNVDIDELEQLVTRYTRTWEEDLQAVLVKQKGEQEGLAIFAQLAGVFPPGYQDDYWPTTAYSDIDYLLSLSADNPVQVSLYEWMVAGRAELRFKLYHHGTAIPISDVIPVLENLGVRTIEEHPYELHLSDQRVWVHDFVLEPRSETFDLNAEVRSNFESAFLAVWHNVVENDEFNRLVTCSELDHREISVIRAYSRYFAQIQNTFSQPFVANTLIKHRDVATRLYNIFDARHNPAHKRNAANKIIEQLIGEVSEYIDAVENLAEDRVLRRFTEMIQATQRTNHYQRDDSGESRPSLALKILPNRITDMPQPRPAYEIFVYSRRVEGVHLRGGKVARGGIRWSDRTEDYRTEVLGLMKAQRVKNSVIVPVGAKGGFLPRQLPETGGREAIMAEGIACYRIFIGGMLDITDNMVKGKVVKPRNVVCHDDDDPYLVVAADKGTATFSDIANEISEQYQFWLGDAFASGGSNGYDHKAMGITARGAWKSVEQHFRELMIDTQATTFSVVGIGDMSGDVFGNGMLCSDKILLVAAFNHLHIFVDPEPNAHASFAERERLFQLPRSAWEDYDTSLISKGGGVFSRAAKSIPISKEMKRRFDISANTLTPNQLISHILKSPCDLLWNGGIGTYVKSKTESHLDVGDKANDGIRVNGGELRCQVIGEGGNLGATQLGRVEFSRNGGRCFTDFIDNAGGVNCSDTEVNIKILLNQLIEQKKLNANQRNRLLQRMTNAVGDIVLENNYDQAQAINLMMHNVTRRGFEYARVMVELSNRGKLDPELEFLPSEEVLQERLKDNQSFTAPEVAVLTSYVKSTLKEDLLKEDIDQAYFDGEIARAFPVNLMEKYKNGVSRHSLRREIIATQVANGMINKMGLSFISRIAETTGASVGQISLAYLTARDIFGLDQLFDQLAQLDNRIRPDLQKSIALDLVRLVRRSTRWLLRHTAGAINPGKDIPRYQKSLGSLVDNWDQVLSGQARQECAERLKEFETRGIDGRLAQVAAGSHYLYELLSIDQAASASKQSVDKVGTLHFLVGEKLALHWFSREMNRFQSTTRWQALAREALQDELHQQQAAITRAVLDHSDKRGSAVDMFNAWQETHAAHNQRWQDVQQEISKATVKDLSIFTVGLRELNTLSQSVQ